MPKRRTSETFFLYMPGKWTSLMKRWRNDVNGGIPAHAINSEYVLLSEE